MMNDLVRLLQLKMELQRRDGMSGGGGLGGAVMGGAAMGGGAGGGGADVFTL